MDRREIGREARRILVLAWPVALTNLQWILLNLIDTALVGRSSTTALGHLSAGRAITYVAVVCAIAALSGILVFAARADGAGTPRAAGDVLRQGLLFAAVMAAVASLTLWLFADRLMIVAGVPTALAHGGAFYVRMMALAYPPQFLFIAAGYFLEGISRPRVAMWVNIVTLPVNTVFAWALIGGHGGLPALGAGGAALGTALTELGAATFMLVYVHRMAEAAHYGVARTGEPFAARWGRAWREGAALRRFGFAPGISTSFEIVGFAVLIALSTRFGQATAGAFQAAIAWDNFALAASLGLGSAAGVRVANAVGAGEIDEVARRGWIAVGLALVVLIGIALAFRFAAELLVPVISTDPQVVAEGTTMLRRLAPWLPFDGVQIVFLFALRSLGDQIAAGAVSVACFFVLMGGGGWWLIHRGAGPLALIEALVAGIVVAAVLQGARFAWASRARRLGKRDLAGI